MRQPSKGYTRPTSGKYPTNWACHPTVRGALVDSITCHKQKGVFFQWKLANRKFPFNRSTSKHVPLQNTWLSRCRSESIALFSTKDEPAKFSHFFHTCAWQQKAMVSLQLGWVPTLCWGSSCKQSKHIVLSPHLPPSSSTFQYLPHQGIHPLLSMAFLGNVYIFWCPGGHSRKRQVAPHHRAARTLLKALDGSQRQPWLVWPMKCGG